MCPTPLCPCPSGRGTFSEMTTLGSEVLYMSAARGVSVCDTQTHIMASPPTPAVANTCCTWPCWSCGVGVHLASLAGACLQECHSSAEKSLEIQQSLQRQAPRGTSRPIGGSQTRSQEHLIEGTAPEMILHFEAHNSQAPFLCSFSFHTTCFRKSLEIW